MLNMYLHHESVLSNYYVTFTSMLDCGYINSEWFDLNKFDISICQTRSALYITVIALHLTQLYLM